MAHPPSTQTSRASQTLSTSLPAGWLAEPFPLSHPPKPTRLCPIHHQRLVREAITVHQFCPHTLLAPVQVVASRQNIPLCPGRPGPLCFQAIILYTQSSKSRSILVDPNPSGSLSPDSSPFSSSLFLQTFTPSLPLFCFQTSAPSPIPHLQPNLNLLSPTFTMASRFVASRLASAARVNVAAASKRSISGT